MYDFYRWIKLSHFLELSLLTSIIYFLASRQSVVSTEIFIQDKRRWELVNDILKVFRIKHKMIVMS